MKLIGYTLLTFFIIFIFYNEWLVLFPGRQNARYFQSWWQENTAKIEAYMYGEENYSIVITGTSMSAFIPAKLFTKKTYNLGFIGGSAVSGLEVVKRNGTMPEVLIIETNWIERGAGVALPPSFAFKHPGKDLMKSLPALRDANQPVNVVSNFVLNGDAPDTHSSTTDSSFFKIKLAENVASHNGEVDTVSLEKSLRSVNEFILFFKQKGVKVYLMEIPAHPLITSSKKYQYTRKAIKKIIDANNYIQIPEYPNIDQLQTSDGYHLTKESIYKYTLFLNKVLKKEHKRNNDTT